MLPRALSGANTAPILARAANTGTAASEVSLHQSTRSPAPDSVAEQRVGDAIRLAVEFAERERFAVERGRDRVGRDPCRMLEHRIDRQAHGPQHRARVPGLLVNNCCR